MSVHHLRASTSWEHASCEGTPDCPPRCPRFIDAEGQSALVRPYVATDYDSLVDMYVTFDPAHRAQGLPPRTVPSIERWLDPLLEEGEHVVAVLDGRVVGHCFYTPSSHAEPEMAVFVHGDFQRRGYGTELCKHAIAAASANDRVALVLEVERHNRPAVRVYRNLGFETVDRYGCERQMRLPLSDPIATRVRLPPAARA